MTVLTEQICQALANHQRAISPGAEAEGSPLLAYRPSVLVVALCLFDYNKTGFVYEKEIR